MKKILAIVAASAAMGMLAPAGAVNFKFKGEGGDYDTPTSNIAVDCGTVGTDLCTDDDSLGFDYSKAGVAFNATAYKDIAAGESSDTSGTTTLLIQDLFPVDSGLGALSEGDNINDQTQFDTGESIRFDFDGDTKYILSNIEFNAGNDKDCSLSAGEGGCGDFELFIDGASQGVITAVDLLAGGFIGNAFEFVAVTEGAGFAIAQFDVREVPIPGALPLLLSGLAGLGFASRRRKQA